MECMGLLGSFCRWYFVSKSLYVSCFNFWTAVAMQFCLYFLWTSAVSNWLVCVGVCYCQQSISNCLTVYNGMLARQRVKLYLIPSTRFHLILRHSFHFIPLYTSSSFITLNPILIYLIFSISPYFTLFRYFTSFHRM